MPISRFRDQFGVCSALRTQLNKSTFISAQIAHARFLKEDSLGEFVIAYTNERGQVWCVESLHDVHYGAYVWHSHMRVRVLASQE